MDEIAIAASIVLSPPEKSITWKSESVPIRSSGSLPPSAGPGWSAASPMLALLLLASTWLLLST